MHTENIKSNGKVIGRYIYNDIRVVATEYVCQGCHERFDEELVVWVMPDGTQEIMEKEGAMPYCENCLPPDPDDEEQQGDSK